MVNLDSRILIPPDVLFQEVDDELVLLDLRSEAYFGVDGVGARAWQLVAHGYALGEVIALLQEEYEVLPERLRDDVLAFVQALLDAGLVAVDDGP